MEVTITAVKPFLMTFSKGDMLLNWKKKSAVWSESLFGVILSGSLKSRHLHIPNGHVH